MQGYSGGIWTSHNMGHSPGQPYCWHLLHSLNTDCTENAVSSVVVPICWNRDMMFSTVLPCNDHLYSFHFPGFQPLFFNGNDYEMYSFRSCISMQFRRSLAFQRNIRHPNSWSARDKKWTNKKQGPTSCSFLSLPWRWKRHISSKCWTLSETHCITTEKKVCFN